MAKFKNTGIVGLGLIGGSIALGMKKRRISEKITGFSRRPETLEKAKSQGLIDEYYTDFDEGLDGLDFLVLATPVDIIKEYFERIKKHGSRVLVTDGASVKEKICREAFDLLGPGNSFVPSHPMAGSEKSGMDQAMENLFENRYVIMTPGSDTGEKNLESVKGFWESLGAKTILMSPSEHDRMVGLTSHMPHLAVYCLISLLEKEAGPETLYKCLGTGFRDTTRIGKSSPSIWSEIFMANRDNLCFWIGEMEKSLEEMKSLLVKGSRKELESRLKSLRTIREKADEKN